ncbi:hypothetical protein [Erysipelatoclostridium sp. An15]|uniref:hypothetical protein n=1 Tax=Erysipelatoclostridium sp. An15 TaxID=1965566 RepID=UPI0013022C69|nr:hypothetical protein [Erysipelatoclostridium sp. An15]
MNEKTYLINKLSKLTNENKESLEKMTIYQLRNMYARVTYNQEGNKNENGN